MSMEIEIQYLERMEKIPDLVMRVANNNPLIHKIAQQFGHGQVITLEECLSLMVVQMDKDWSAVAKRNYELMMRCSEPISVKPNPVLSTSK